MCEILLSKSTFPSSALVAHNHDRFGRSDLMFGKIAILEKKII